MFIKVEPAGFFMYTVKLIYDLEKPDSEDQQVRDYLVENELEPKYQGTGEYEGSNCELMQFGGCYLGKHLQIIGAIQRRAVETEILTEEIQKHLNSAFSKGLTVEDGQREEVVARLVEEFHQNSIFQTNDIGELVVSLDQKEVVESARRVLRPGHWRLAEFEDSFEKCLLIETDIGAG